MNRICDSFVQTGTTAKIRKTLAKDSLQVTVDTHSHNLESNPTPLVRALRHIGEPREFDCCGPFRAVGYVHRLHVLHSLLNIFSRS